MRIINSFKIAFSMFSKIPVGNADWSKENMQYSMCFIPLIGAINAGMLYLWYLLYVKLQFNDILFGAVAIVLPIFITGGIHMDGFCDVIDSLSSFASKEKRLEILKDPHVGAFAIIWGCAYMIVAFALMTNVTLASQVYIIGVGYVLSRSISCLLAIFMKNAKREGTLYTFTSRQSQKAVACVLVLYIFACVALLCILHFYVGLLIVLLSFLIIIYYIRMTTRNFGGITGDMAGYFIQLYELMVLFVVVLALGRF